MLGKTLTNHLRIIITRAQHGFLYEATLGTLAVLSLLLLGYELLLEPTPLQIKVLHDFDLGVAWIFLFDFIVGFTVSFDRNKYTKQNWLNLLSSIPVSSEGARTLRVLRIVRSLRIIRALAAVSNIQRAKKVIGRRILHIK